MKQKPLTVALVGNPNSGKSSLFNLLTGLNQKISNFPGTTVDRKTGTMRYGQQSAKLIDLPGIYSLFPKSADEKVSAAVLMDDDEISSPDLIVAVIDASNLKRNMLLFTQVADLQKPMILALNMLDLARSKGIFIDIASLSRKLGIGVVAINARENTGIAELQRMIFGANAPVQQSFFKPWPEACQLIESYQSTFPMQQDFRTWLHIHYKGEGKPELRREIVHMQAQETIERYRLVDRLLKNSYHYDALNDTGSLTYKLDRILTHRVWGFVSFFLLLLLMFQAIFSLEQLSYGPYRSRFFRPWATDCADITIGIPEQYAGKRGNSRAKRCGDLPAADHYPVHFYCCPGRYRLYVAGKLYHGPHDAPFRA